MAVAAGGITLGDEGRGGFCGGFAVGVLYRINRRAGWLVELLCACVEDVDSFAVDLIIVDACIFVVAVGVIDCDARLNVIAENIEANALSAVLKGNRLHANAVGKKIVALEDGGHSVKHVVACIVYVIGDHVFKGEHPLDVHVTSTCDEIFGVGIFARKLKPYEMTAVVEIFSVNAVVF